ncbi:MAG: acetyl-CoA carboxylase biotin carboxyl carrier protein [Candidatus Sumerlaeia bacterium]|nr:acetyl-CoA carboxylase biotin carboxyl carrier protein [Candidatus Sumerlaeia bacterium]
MATRKTAANSANDALSREDIEKLLDVIHKKGIEEFELEQSGTRLRVVANRASQVVAQAPVAQINGAPNAPGNEVAATSSTPEAVRDEDNPAYKKITSPMVGTFYRAASPGSRPYVEVGDKVDEDSVLCIIEAMKLMNEIKAECRGHVKKILVENAQPVEYGQVLFLVEPS